MGHRPYALNPNRRTSTSKYDWSYSQALSLFENYILFFLVVCMEAQRQSSRLHRIDICVIVTEQS